MFESSTARLRALLARWTGEGDDEAARERGWEIEYGRFGKRVYRDPRFRAALAQQGTEVSGDDWTVRAETAASR